MDYEFSLDSLAKSTRSNGAQNAVKWSMMFEFARRLTLNDGEVSGFA